MNIRILEIDDISAAREAIKLTGADPYSVGIMAPKALFRTVLIASADNRAAALLKQEMLSLGGEAAVSEKVSRFEKGFSSVLLMGTVKKYELLVKKLSTQPFGLKIIASDIESVLKKYENSCLSFRAGKFNVKLSGNPLVMGILNITPDSFSDGGKYRDTEKAAARAFEMEEEGAAIIDIGGESSRPGAKPVTEKEEIARVVPVIRKIAKRIKLPVSVDTYKPGVAKAVLDEGAVIVNDITALRHGGEKMAGIISKHGAAVILMHMAGTPRTMQKDPRYLDVVTEIADLLEEQTGFSLSHGVKRESILIDPGIGFGKTASHNIEILKRFREFKALGQPIVAGLSRKSFIGNILGGVPAGERLSGSLAGSAWAVLNGANILRAHDVKETVQALKMLKCLVGNL